MGDLMVGSIVGFSDGFLLLGNAISSFDPLKNSCMFDPVGGSVSLYDSHVKLEPLPA